MKKTIRNNKRRHLGGAALGRMGFCTSWAVDVHGGGAEWIEVVEVDLHLDNLPEQFINMRIVHISDLHCSRTVSGKYLRHCIERVNQLDADVVLLTGDYITHDIYGRFHKRIVELVSNISSRYGTYACMGNHDYGVNGIFGSLRHDRLYAMTEGMESCGINVLRNESVMLTRGGQRLCFVGLGDLWANDFEPVKAFADIETGSAVIVLAHNPESVKHMEGFSYNAIMCGHTHGVPTQFSRSFGGALLNRHDHYSGLYHIGDKKLYVNRGLGRMGKMFFNSSPEITVFNLSAAPKYTE
jgi:predicted MPP superfamily phosphohydrolase